MKIITSFALVAVLGLLVSCTPMNPHPMDMTQAIQNAKTRADHEALAKHYEDAAKEMEAKADDHKQRMRQYEANRVPWKNYIGNYATQHGALIRNYEQAAAANMSIAQSHRQMAKEAN